MVRITEKEVMNRVWGELYERKASMIYDNEKHHVLPTTERHETFIFDNDIPNIEDVSIPHWRLLPIIGKAPEHEFWYRLANGVFNVNMRMRSEDQLAYLEERDYFHDMFGHVPILHDREFSNYIKSLGLIAQYCSPTNTTILKGLSNIYWHTAEFGLVYEEDFFNSNEKVLTVYGAGIISSVDEHRFVSGRFEIKPTFVTLFKDMSIEDLFNLDSYVTDGFQNFYVVLEDWNDLKKIIKYLWSIL